MQWQNVIDSLMPVVLSREDLPEKPEAIYFIGRSKHYLNDSAGAISYYEMLRSQFSTHPYCEFALYSLGWLYFEADETDKALQVIDEFSTQFAASPMTPYIRYLRAAIFNRQGKFEEALHNLEGINCGISARSKIWMMSNSGSLKICFSWIDLSQPQVTILCI